MIDRLELTRKAVDKPLLVMTAEMQALASAEHSIRTLNNMFHFSSKESLEEALVDCAPRLLSYGKRVQQLKTYVKLRDNEEGEISELYDDLITAQQRLMARQIVVEQEYKEVSKRIGEK